METITHCLLGLTVCYVPFMLSHVYLVGFIAIIILQKRILRRGEVNPCPQVTHVAKPKSTHRCPTGQVPNNSILMHNFQITTV